MDNAPLLGLDNAHIALQSFFHRVAVIVHESLLDAEEIERNELVIKQRKAANQKLVTKNRNLHLKAYEEIVMRYPYSTLRAQDENALIDMCLLTKTNVELYEREKNASSYLMRLTDTTDLTADPDLLKQIQVYLDCDLESKEVPELVQVLTNRKTLARKKLVC